MRRLLFVLAIAASAGSEAAVSGGMRLLAKGTSTIQVSVDPLDVALTSNGASTDAVRNQIELAMRRCGFAISAGSKAAMWVHVDGKSLENRRGFFANALVHVSVDAYVAGVPDMVKGGAITVTVFHGADALQQCEARIAMVQQGRQLPYWCRK